MRLVVIVCGLLLGLSACGSGSESSTDHQPGTKTKPVVRRAVQSVGPGKTFPSCEKFADAFREIDASMIRSASKGKVIEVERANNRTAQLIVANKECVPKDDYSRAKQLLSEPADPLLPKGYEDAPKQCVTAFSDALVLQAAITGRKDSGASGWKEMLKGFEALRRQHPTCFDHESVDLMNEHILGQ